MVLYGDCSFFFSSERCIDKINRSRPSIEHLQKIKTDVDKDTIGVLTKENDEYIRELYKHGIKTDDRVNFLSDLCRKITIICFHSKKDFIKICLPVYLFGPGAIKEVIESHKSAELCRCKNNYEQNNLEHIEVFIQRSGYEL